MFRRIDLQESWDCAHKKKPISVQPDANFIAFIEYLRPQFPISTPILDAGCGRGRNTHYLSRQGYTTYGCDLSPIATTKARKQSQQMGVKADYLVADLTQLPFLEGYFDIVICVHVLPYHFKAGIVQCIHQLWRILRSDGWLYLDLLAREDAEYGQGKELEQHTFLDPDGVPIHFSSEQEVSELLEGFTIERLTRLKSGAESRKRIAWGIWATKY